MKKFFILLVVLSFFTACGGPSFKVNDVVLADWYQGNWHIAKVSEVCKEGGWKLKFNDNFYNSGDGQAQICYTEDKMVQNVTPAANEIKVGNTVLAEWKEDAYYSAKVQKIEGDNYFVKFLIDGLELQLTLDKLRVLPVQKTIDTKTK